MTRDWERWHRYYDRPDSSLVRRLEAVRHELRGALTHASPGADGVVRLTSICAGEGRDVLPVLAELDGTHPVRATLIELDPLLAGRARQTAAEFGLRGVEVRLADAGAPQVYYDVPRAQVLTVCGVFGNISVEDVHTTIAALPGLLAPGGAVIWTRGVQDADRTPDIRAAFDRHGFTEVSFTSTPDGDFRIGTHRLTADPVAGPIARMFTFT